MTWEEVRAAKHKRGGAAASDNPPETTSKTVLDKTTRLSQIAQRLDAIAPEERRRYWAYFKWMGIGAAGCLLTAVAIAIPVHPLRWTLFGVLCTVSIGAFVWGFVLLSRWMPFGSEKQRLLLERRRLVRS
jgi:hypothetical protein